MAVTVGSLIDSVVQLVTQFAKVGTGVDPMTSALLLSGAIFVGFAMVVFGYLTIGGVLSALVSLVPSGGPPQPPQRE